MSESLHEELSALIDGALPEERAAELRALIESDHDVRREYESLRRTVDAVRALPRRPAPAALADRLAQPPPRARRLTLPRLAAIASVVAAGVLAAVLLRADAPEPAAPVETAEREDAEPVRDGARAGKDEEAPKALERLEKKAEARNRAGVPRAQPENEAPDAEGLAREAADAVEKDDDEPLAEVAEAERESVRKVEEDPIDRYLATLETLDAGKLRVALASLPPAPAPDPAPTTPAAPKRQPRGKAVAPAFEANVASREEAMRVASLLRRAYRPPQKEKKKSGLLGASAPADAGEAMPALLVEIAANPAQERHLRALLAHIDRRRPPAERARPDGAKAEPFDMADEAPAPGLGGGGAAGAGAKRARPRLLKVRLVYPPPPKR